MKRFAVRPAGWGWNRTGSGRGKGSHVAGALLLWLVASPCWAQLGGIDAEFAGAGARPLAMGGAFLGLGDDATAAEFNPAGLQILRRPEIAWQGTYTLDQRDEFRPNSSLDLNRAVVEEDHNEWLTPSFLSYVHPGQKVTWALSQLTTIDFDHDYSDLGSSRFNSFSTEATNNAFGLTFATDLKPRLHVGVTLRMNRFHYEFTEFDSGPIKGNGSALFTTEFTDWSPSFNLGVLWRATKKWSFGAVYKSRQEVSNGVFTTHLPQTFGVGTAYHPNDRVRVLADVDHITWSDFDSNPSDPFVREDVTRYHLGGEYLFKLEEERAWFVRGGLMREDSNALYYNGKEEFPSSVLLAAFPQQPERNHVSFGLGLATEKYQIDFAVDHVLDAGTIFILSMIHYF
ncbi:MAG: outer membrane protein transport protein [Candidatus Omnitrophica bacterium]|nr:outer membrane protein transport protein [Candidatus Omnitrophota bacterium]